MIKVQGIDTYPTTGRLDMTIVAITPADARLSLPQALLAYWLPHRDALPRDAVYAPGKSAEQVENEDADMMETAQDDAVVAVARRWTASHRDAGHLLSDGRRPCAQAVASGRSGGVGRRHSYSGR